MLINFLYFPITPDKNSQESTLQEIVQPDNTVKETYIGNRLYQEETTESLKLVLKVAFDKYGIPERLPEAEYTITNESGWNCNADNGLSKGCSQFILSTWLSSCSDTDDRTDPYKSFDCMAKLWSKGYDYYWDSYCFHYSDIDCELKRNLFVIN